MNKEEKALSQIETVVRFTNRLVIRKFEEQLDTDLMNCLKEIEEILKEWKEENKP